MNTSQLLARLGTVNPWWRNPANWRNEDPDLRSVLEAGLTYEPLPLVNLKLGGLYVLRGPRRVGKSVELKKAIVELLASGISPRRIIHFPCDELDAEDLSRLVPAARKVATGSETEPRYWFLDEITALSGKWWATIKWLRDNNAGFRDDCIVLTGSSMRGMDEGVKALAGRRGTAADSERLLLPMGFRAFFKNASRARPLPDDDLYLDAWEAHAPKAAAALGQLVPWLEDLILSWEAFLQVGGFPRAVADFIHKSAVQPDFTNALWDVIAGDALRRARDFTPAKAKLLLTFLSGALTQPLNFAGLGQQLGVASGTAQGRLDDLIAAFVCWPCFPMSRRGRPDHEQPSGAHPKCYYTDSLLARLACLRDPENIHCPDPAALSEQQFGLTLLRQRERQLPGSYAQFASLMYTRTTSKEVDFVAGWMRDVAYESKYVAAGLKRESRTIRALTDKGVMLTRSLLDLEGDVWAVPVSMAAWLLDPLELGPSP